MLFIAEVGSNHNQDLSRYLKLIDTAAEIGCGAVKFQLFKIDQMYAPEVLARDKKLQALKSRELPLEFIPEIEKRCRENDLNFICSPFYLDAVKQLKPFVYAFKIGSFELLWLDLIKKCGDTGKPVILSTGMADLPEINEAMTASGQNPLLLHCVSSYPLDIRNSNLRAIGTLQRSFGARVGWSDHSVSEAVISRAVFKWGAVCVEFHLDLDGSGLEFGNGHCWLPMRAKAMVDLVYNGQSADGDGIKIPDLSELENIKWRADAQDGMRPQKELR